MDTLGIDWKIPTEHAILSEKDTKHDVLKDFDSPFVIIQMNTKQQIAQQRANLAIAKFLKELFTPPYVISESTFDETKESAVECAKQNVDAASLTEREKEVAKESVELFANDVARKFKVAMKQSGKIV